jgi:hypothetical protein
MNDDTITMDMCLGCGRREVHPDQGGLCIVCIATIHATGTCVLGSVPAPV